MRVLLLPGDKSGCGLYRMLMPGRAVVNSGADVEITVAEGLHGRWRRDPVTNRPIVESIPELPFDVVVFQRASNDLLVETIPHVQAQGVAVVTEIDDDLQRVNPKNITARYVDPHTSPSNNWHHLRRATEMADLVTCSTPALTHYAPHGRYRVVRNYVPQSLTRLNKHDQPQPAKEDGVRLGWTGTVETHPDDLCETRGAVADLMVARDDVSLRVVGKGTGVAHDLNLDRKGISPERVTATGWIDLPNYPQTVYDNIDVGLVPLTNHPFNQSKSALKGLEFAALGIPFVASPTAEYRHIAGCGIGETASGYRSWATALQRLTGSAAAREELGARYREIVLKHWTIEQHAEEWYDAWVAACANRDIRMRAGLGAAHAVGAS